MSKALFRNAGRQLPGRVLRSTLYLLMFVFLSGCYFTAAVRDFQRDGVAGTPWWCLGTPNLTEQECLLFSLQLDVAVKNAYKYPTLGDFTASGAVALGPWPGNSGVAYGSVAATFNPNMPNVRLYDGNLPDSRLVGIGWAVDEASVTPPAGFPGLRDVWAAGTGTDWWLAAWAIRGYQNHPDVFASSHPCLTATASILTATTDACYIAAHPEPFEILVSNDDGVQAAGIDALVEGLYGLPNTIINVVAPFTNQSASGGSTSPPGEVVSGSPTTTASGKPATAVFSTDPADPNGSGSPADAVIFALQDQLLTPEVLLSGINSGQNYSNIARVFSGTVGAARAGRSRGVPAIATSQGLVGGTPVDFPAGVTASLALLEQWRLGQTVNTTKSVLNINIPTCVPPLTPRGTLFTEVKVALEPTDDYGLQDCASTEPLGNISNDLEAFNHGFIGITDINRTESLKVTSYNVGLALNFVPYTLERLVANEILLADYDSDVVCLQEVWLDDSVNAVVDALDDAYPYIYIEPPEQVFSAGAACTLAELGPFAACTAYLCPGLTGAALVACAPSACAQFIPGLSASCLDGVIGAVGIPNVTLQQVIDTVTQPAGKFAFDGSLGLILASKHELLNREFQDFIDNSSGNHRGALYAEIKLNQKTHVVGCTHPTANLEATIPYPASGNFNSWEEENQFMQGEMIQFANAKAGNKPIFFAGDFNCSIANAANGVDAEFAASCQMWLDNGFVDPGADQLPCTFCEAENLILGGGTGASFLDHVFVKNLGNTQPIVADRVFDDTVLIHALNPVSELDPLDSPMVTHPSDHFGVELDIPLPQ